MLSRAGPASGALPNNQQLAAVLVDKDLAQAQRLCRQLNRQPLDNLSAADSELRRLAGCSVPLRPSWPLQGGCRAAAGSLQGRSGPLQTSSKRNGSCGNPKLKQLMLATLPEQASAQRCAVRCAFLCRRVCCIAGALQAIHCVNEQALIGAGTPNERLRKVKLVGKWLHACSWQCRCSARRPRRLAALPPTGGQALGAAPPVPAPCAVLL
jgi:hypothetical protein